MFTEVVVAPAYDDAALAALTAKKNLRVLSAPAARRRRGLDLRSIDGGLLVQQADTVTLDRATWRVVTKVAPTERAVERPRLRLAGVRRGHIATRSCSSKDRQAVGIGAGQQNRVDSARIAATKAAGRAAGGAAPATPSSRSATASTPRPTPASPR